MTNTAQRAAAGGDGRAVRILEGDALAMLATLEPGSIDACVTDPPYGLKFMGKAWDHGVPGVLYWAAVRHVLKPGAHLLAFGGTRTYHRLTCAIEDAGFEIRDCLSWMYGSGFPKGKGCLKPGWEPIILARKPGPSPWLNVDGCRIGTDVLKSRKSGFSDSPVLGSGSPGFIYEGAEGRWPANVCLDEEAASILDLQTGTLTSGANPTRRSSAVFKNTYGEFAGQEECTPIRGSDSGGASRFFYVAKASTAERGPFNSHPCVKPLALMSRLVKLVTPTGGTVLDPFMGSGSTLIAADRLGLDCIGIDNDPHSVEIARAASSRTHRCSRRPSHDGG